MRIGRVLVRAVGLLVGVAVAATALAEAPSAYDLRDYGWSTSVKDQTGGTCWAHGAMAAIESNLLRTGRWADYLAGGVETESEPNLAEYHLDWWNGFNEYNNDDTSPPNGGLPGNGNGLEVHQGGDYRVTTAYVTRGEGAVSCEAANDATEKDAVWYGSPPSREDSGYRKYYSRNVNWYTVGDGSGGIDRARSDLLKETIMNHGAVGTCMYSGGGYYSGGIHYQPFADTRDPNHSVAIVGWDDTIQVTGAPADGAWLCKNSWGSSFSGDGYFWISYYDKHAARHPEMGAVSFQDVELNEFDQVYSHDLHGWRDTLPDVSQAFNAFTATADEPLTAVGFYTAADNVEYTLKVFDTFEDEQLSVEIAGMTGTIDISGYHTIDLNVPVWLTAGDEFYLSLELSDGGHAIDCTSDVPVLLDKPPAVADGSIVSDAEPGQSYYWGGTGWTDLFDRYLYDADLGREVTGSANFCVKGFTSYAMAVPEPSQLALLASLAAMALAGFGRRRSVPGKESVDLP